MKAVEASSYSGKERDRLLPLRVRGTFHFQIKRAVAPIAEGAKQHRN